MDETKFYIFYDGNCGFCNRWIQWLLKKDVKKAFLFSSLQSDFGQKFLKERGLEQKDFTTLYLWKPNDFYLTKSKAIFMISKQLGGMYGLFSLLRYLPSSITDLLYDFIAKRRHQINTSQCIVPSEEIKKRFIS